MVWIDLKSFVPAIIMVSVVFVPVFIAIGVLYHQKWIEKKDERRSPLTDKLLHQPGAQARKQADEIADEIASRIAVLLLIGPVVLMAILLPRVRWSKIEFGWFEWGLIGGALIAIVLTVQEIVRFRAKRRNWLNGMRGEMAAAQELDRLQGKGCLVFHDVPFDRGNIDHVVVAPKGVFAVETKWRSKRGDGKKSAGVSFDGKVLAFPNGYVDTKPTEQVRACASELAKYLKGKTGEYVKVTPVVALPGWFVTNKASPLGMEIVAINPKLAYTLLDRPGTLILPAQRERIINALADQYPRAED